MNLKRMLSDILRMTRLMVIILILFKVLIFKCLRKMRCVCILRRILHKQKNTLVYGIVYAVCICVSLRVAWTPDPCVNCSIPQTVIYKEPTKIQFEFSYTFQHNYIDPDRYDFLLLDNNKCENKGIVILVQTAAGHIQLRNFIRSTYGSDRHLSRYNATMVFFVGVSMDIATMTTIQEESRVHGDIIQQNFIDSRRNGTLKAISWLKWFAEFCHHVENVVQLDDDVFMDLDAVSTWFRERLPRIYRNTPYLVACAVYNNIAPPRITGSYYTPVEEYIFNTTLPPFCSGTALLLNRAAMLGMYSVCKGVEYLWLEDVFQFLILGQKIGLYLHDIKPLIYHALRPDNKTFSAKEASKYMFIYHRTLPQLETLWESTAKRRH